MTLLRFQREDAHGQTNGRKTNDADNVVNRNMATFTRTEIDHNQTLKIERGSLKIKVHRGSSGG